DGKNAYGMIDKSGEFIFKPIQSDYEVYFGVFTGGLNTMYFYGTEGSSYGLFDEKGKILIPLGAANYIQVSPAGIATVMKNNKWAIINKDGAMITGYEYAFIDEFGEKQNVVRAAKGDYASEEKGYVYVENGVWGGIDKQGREVIPFKFSYISTFKEGLAAAASAESPEKIAYTDLEGNWVLPFK
ncbi:MAG: WG repeat-containing protein, partial [Flammeovirgaceae bacterium]|nr:WG repeat-containing protein [Flammeovirgaceae bacterium]